MVFAWDYYIWFQGFVLHTILVDHFLCESRVLLNHPVILKYWICYYQNSECTEYEKSDFAKKEQTNLALLCRVARWFVSKPKIPI
jgi:hypothetical protein